MRSLAIEREAPSTEALPFATCTMTSPSENEMALETIWVSPGNTSEPTFQRIKMAVEKQSTEKRYDLQLEVADF